jgi:membrane-associated protease RseP (regulator of RpoE activity)
VPRAAVEGTTPDATTGEAKVGEAPAARAAIGGDEATPQDASHVTPDGDRDGVARPLEESRAVARTELERFLDQGIPATLQQVPVQPVFSKGHLLGYQVISFFAGRPDIASRAGIIAGDVITHVNGQPVARPEDLWSVWEAMRSSPRITIDLVRDGQPLRLAWKVEDGGQPGL